MQLLFVTIFLFQHCLNKYILKEYNIAKSVFYHSFYNSGTCAITPPPPLPPPPSLNNSGTCAITLPPPPPMTSIPLRCNPSIYHYNPAIQQFWLFYCHQINWCARNILSHHCHSISYTKQTFQHKQCQRLLICDNILPGINIKDTKLTIWPWFITLCYAERGGIWRDSRPRRTCVNFSQLLRPNLSNKVCHECIIVLARSQSSFIM